MARYINADLTYDEILDKVQAETSDGDTFITVRRILNSFPAEDVAPVKHGHWENEYYDWGTDSFFHTCSCCHRESINYGDCNFCSVCGAKMERGDEDES